jgi:hypothetical protein
VLATAAATSASEVKVDSITRPRTGSGMIPRGVLAELGGQVDGHGTAQ